MKANILTIPGWTNSGPRHWMTLWEKENPHIERVIQDNWDWPQKDAWVARLEETVKKTAAPCVLLAHSLGCLTIVHWAKLTALKIELAVLVAPCDTEKPGIPSILTRFNPIPLTPLPFASFVFASRNDEFCSYMRAETFASSWRSKLIDVGLAGHIDSGQGDWDEGKQLIFDLCRG